MTYEFSGSSITIPAAASAVLRRWQIRSLRETHSAAPSPARMSAVLSHKFHHDFVTSCVCIQYILTGGRTFKGHAAAFIKLAKEFYIRESGGMYITRQHGQEHVEEVESLKYNESQYSR